MKAFTDFTDGAVLARLGGALERRLPVPDAHGCRRAAPGSGSNAFYISYMAGPGRDKQITARRASWCVQNTTVPDKMPPGVVVSTCAHEHCCSHVELVSRAEQIARYPRRRNWREMPADFPDQVRAAAALDPAATQKALARRFGVSQCAVGRVLSGKTYQ